MSARSPTLPILGALGATLCLMFAGCSLGSRRGPPTPPSSAVPRPPSVTPLPPPPSNLDAIPDAVPRAEPRARLGNPPFYSVAGKRYVLLASSAGYVEHGVASWYGPDFHGVATATGEPYDMYAMTAAHKTLPLPCYARVTNLRNGRSVVIRINDRGPFVDNRIIDLSYTAAAKLDMIRDGTALVEVRVVGPDELPGVALASRTAAPAASPVSAPIVATPMDKLYVQAGAFADGLNAQRLAERLRAAGLTSVGVTSSLGPRRLFRVRLGPVASVEEFDRLAGRLAELGVPDARLALE